MLKKSRNPAIDFSKFIASLMVIGLHTVFLEDINYEVNFVIVHILFRLSVPFFVICTGFYLSLSLESHSYSYLSIHRQELKLIKMYSFWTIIYLLLSIPKWIQSGWFSISAFKDFVVATITNGSHYHLWYIISLIYALPIFWLIAKFVKNKSVIVVLAVMLYSFQLIVSGYGFFLPENVFYTLKTTEWFWALYRAVFFMLPFLILGKIVATGIIMTKRTAFFGTIISITLLFAEVYLLRSLQVGMSFYIMTMPTMYFLFQLILQISFPFNVHVCTILGASSTLIYCIHPAIYELLNKFFSGQSFLYILTAFLSVVFSVVYIVIKRRISKNRSEE